MKRWKIVHIIRHENSSEIFYLFVLKNEKRKRKVGACARKQGCQKSPVAYVVRYSFNGPFNDRTHVCDLNTRRVVFKSPPYYYLHYLNVAVEQLKSANHYF